MRLTKTYRALKNLQSDYSRRGGAHMTEERLAYSMLGSFQHRDIDPNKDSSEKIDPLAEGFSGLPQVAERRPRNNLLTNILIYAGRRSEVRQEWQLVQDARLQLLSSLAIELSGLLDFRDRGSIILMGSTEGMEVPGSSVARDATNPDRAAQLIIAMSHREGFNILLSDDLEDLIRVGLSGIRPKSTVAVKVNHALDLKLPPHAGVVSMGGAREVNTNNPTELAEVNASLANAHQATIDYLSSKGIPTAAPILFDGRFPNGFDDGQVDNRISGAIKRITDAKI